MARSAQIPNIAPPPDAAELPASEKADPDSPSASPVRTPDLVPPSELDDHSTCSPKPLSQTISPVSPMMGSYDPHWSAFSSMSAKPGQSPAAVDKAVALQPVSQQHYGSGQHYSIASQEQQQPIKEQGDYQMMSSGQAHTTASVGINAAIKELVAEAPPTEAASAAKGAGNDVLTASAIHHQEPKEQETTTAADGDEEAISGAWIPWIQDPASEEFLGGASDEAGKIPLSPSNGRTTGEAVINDPEVKSAADETDDIWGWVSSPKNSP